MFQLQRKLYSLVILIIPLARGNITTNHVMNNQGFASPSLKKLVVPTTASNVINEDGTRFLETKSKFDSLNVQLDDFAIQLIIARSSDDNHDDVKNKRGRKWLRPHPKGTEIDESELNFLLNLHLQRYYSKVFTSPPVVNLYLNLQKLSSSTSSKLRYSLTGDLIFATTNLTQVPSKQNITSTTLLAISFPTTNDLLKALRSSSDPTLRHSQSITSQQGETFYDDDDTSKPKKILKTAENDYANDVNKGKFIITVVSFVIAGFLLAIVINIVWNTVSREKTETKPLRSNGDKSDESTTDSESSIFVNI